MPSLTPFSDACNPDDEAFLSASLYRFNATATGVDDGATLAAFARDEEGAIVAGLVGSTWGGTCEIDVLWVRIDHRGRGVGRALLRGAETEAYRRGARSIALDTYSFQAPEFYRREGYETVAEITESPFPPHRRLILRKNL